MSFSEFVEVSLQCDDESHKGFEIIPEKRSLNDLGIEYNDTGNGTRVVNSELMVESVCGESESRKMTRNVKRKLLFEEDPDSSVWNPERKRDGKSLGVSEPPIIALHAPCSFKDYCVSAGWKVTLSEGESTASYCSPTGRIYDSVSKVVEVPSLQVRKSENAQSGSCLSLDNLKPCDSCPLKKTYSRRKPLIRKFTSQVDSDEEVASKHTTILAGKPKAGKEGNGVTEVETGICESIPEVVEALSQHVPKSKNARSGSYQSVGNSKPCDSRPIWNTYNRRKPLIKKITEEMDKGEEVSPKHKSILTDKLKAGNEGNGVTEVETGICESHPEAVEALPQQFSKSVVDSELMDESVSRCSGGLDLDKRHKDMSNQFIIYDMGSGIREDNPLEVCGESESREMNKNMKRKLLLEEDPDWSRIRDRKSLGVSEPPIVALYAPCSFKDFCVSTGWKVTLSEGHGTASYCSPTGGIYGSPSKVVEVLSLQVRKSENAQSGSYLSLDSLKPCDSSSLKKTYSRRKPLIRKFTSQVDSDEEVTSKHMTILAGKPKAGKEGNGVTEIETGICESLPEVVKALSKQAPNSKNAQSGSYQSVDDSKPCDSRPIWNPYNRRKPLIKKITEEMDKGEEVSPKHKSILTDKLKAGKEGNGVTEVETGICESHPEAVEALPQQFSKSVVDSELMDESVSRCSGGLDLDKRHKDMSNQFIIYDMGSGIREDNPFEVCGESESREMNKNMKRKLLLEEDPDWSRIRDRKSLGVSEPPIVALYAPCSFKDLCVSAGWKVTLSEGDGTASYCSPTGGIYGSPSKVVEVLSLQVRKSENAQSVDDSKPCDSRTTRNTYNRRKPLIKEITTQMDKGKEVSPKHKSILAGNLKARKEGNGVTEIETGICESLPEVVVSLSQQVLKSKNAQSGSYQSVDNLKPCDSTPICKTYNRRKPLVRKITTQMNKGKEASPKYKPILAGKLKAGKEGNGGTEIKTPYSFKDSCVSAGWKVILSEGDSTSMYFSRTGDIYDSHSKVVEALSQQVPKSVDDQFQTCQSVDHSKPCELKPPVRELTTQIDSGEEVSPKHIASLVGKPKAGEEDNGVTDMKVGDDNMKQSVEDECLSNEKSSSECESGVTTAGDCDRKFQRPRRSTRVNGRHVAIDSELGSRRCKRINGRHDPVDILELENLSRSPEAYDKENDKEVSQRSGRMKVKEMNVAMSSHVNKEKSGDEKIKQSMEDECLNYEKSSSDCGSRVTTTGNWDRELQDPQRSTRIEGRHVAVDFELGPRIWKGMNGKHAVVDILELKNLPCSPEVYDTENVKDPPIVALPDPCSSENVCLSAGWKVTLPEGDGTTIYSSPAGGLYDSLSNVAEPVSQQVLSSEDAQSGSYQSIDHSKPCELKPLVRELTMQKDSGEEVSPKHMTSLVAKPKAGEKDNGVTDTKVGDDNMKQSLEDECLSNEKSSSECGSGVTTTGDCDGEFQGPRRSTRIKGRHVAVDFELGPRRQKDILDQDERGSSCTEGTCVSSESAASERRYLNGSQIPVDGENNMGVCEVGDCIYTSSCASTRLSKENQPCTVSKDDICESHSSRIDEAKILASKRSSLLNNTFARNRISTGGNGSSSSKTKRKRSTNHEQNDRHKTVINVFSWLINAGTVVENSKVVYTIKNGKGNKLKGSFTRRGIRCYCCREVLSLFEFEAHAGSNLHQPWNKICLASGKSLMQCQNEAWEKEKKLKKIGLEVVSLNDEICAVCVDGGDLILCDGCPLSFHQDCLILQSRPEGNWYCPFCTCTFCMRADCGQVKGSGTGLFNCTQCGCKYGADCMQESDSEKMGPKSVAYCGKSCEKVDYGLLRILGTKHPMGKGFSWTLLRRRDEETAEGSCERQSHIVECNVKLSLARVLLDECFASCENSSTGIDKISQAVYSCGPNGEGFYTVILEKFEEMVSAATIRIHGTRVAEIPFIGTRHIYRKRGMCRLLLRSIEEVLFSLQVKKLIIHAIPDLLETWMKSFAFRQVEPSDEDETKKLKLMRFFGIPLLQKTIYDGTQVEESSNEVQSSCSQESEDVFLQALLEMDIDPKYINTSLW